MSKEAYKQIHKQKKQIQLEKSFWHVNQLTSKVFHMESTPQKWLASDAVEIFVDGRKLNKTTGRQVFHDEHLPDSKTHIKATVIYCNCGICIPTITTCHKLAPVQLPH